MVMVLWLASVLALVCAVWFGLSYRRAPRPWTLATAIVAAVAVVVFAWIALTI